MSLPYDLQYIIISFGPRSGFITVCKNWAEEIKNIQQKATNTIGKWYKPKRVMEKFYTVPEMVRYFVIHYPDKFFLRHPEATISSLGLNEQLTTILPPLVNRKRSEVRDWMLNIPIGFEDWMVVGW
jgi:hypothetical protein